MSRYSDTVWDHLVSVTVLARSRGCHCKRIGLYLNSQCQTSTSKQPLRGWAKFAKQKIAENSHEAWSVAVQNFIFTSPSFLRNRSLHQRRVKPPAALSLSLLSPLSSLSFPLSYLRRSPKFSISRMGLGQATVMVQSFKVSPPNHHKLSPHSLTLC